MVTQKVNIQNKKGHSLHGVVRYVEKEEKIPAIILLHEFGAHSEHEYMVNLSNNLLAQGFLILGFDFHAHGQSEGGMRGFHITQQIDDVRSAIDYLKELEQVDTEKIGIFGHGLGADVALLVAVRDERVRCLVLHAPRAELEEHITSRFANDELAELRSKGYMSHVMHGRIDREFFDHLRKYDAIEEMKKITVPVMFVHGTNDFSIPVTNSRRLFVAANEPKRLEIVEMANHEFTEEEHREYLFEVIDDWFNHWLKSAVKYNYKY